MPVRVERRDRVLIQSRAEARNAVDPEHAQALYEAFVAFDKDEAAAVAVFWGEGGAFCAGADLKILAIRGIATRDNARTHSSLEFPTDGGPVPRGPMGPSRLRLGKPVIAAIEGPAVAGGMELALWADCRIMAEGSYMGVYNRRWGVPLSDGGTVRLPRLVGEGRALELIMTGRKVDADECLRIGLCEMVVPSGQARVAAEDMRMRSRDFRKPPFAPIGAPFICSTACPRARRLSGNGPTAPASSPRRVPPVSRGSSRAPDGMATLVRQQL
jgi:enoyl-CoA hydratase